MKKRLQSGGCLYNNHTSLLKHHGERKRSQESKPLMSWHNNLSKSNTSTQGKSTTILSAISISSQCLSIYIKICVYIIYRQIGFDFTVLDRHIPWLRHSGPRTATWLHCVALRSLAADENWLHHNISSPHNSIIGQYGSWYCWTAGLTHENNNLLMKMQIKQHFVWEISVSKEKTTPNIREWNNEGYKQGSLI